MKRTLYLAGLLLSLFLIVPAGQAKEKETEKMFLQLDKTLQEYTLYEQQYEQKLRRLIQKKEKDPYIYHFNLFRAYCFYNSDSTEYHINRCMEIARKQQDKEREFESLVGKAFYLTSTGLLTEVQKLMEDVDPAPYSNKLQCLYYDWSIYYYHRLSSYINKGELKTEYDRKSIEAIDSIIVREKDPDKLCSMQIARCQNTGQMVPEALKIKLKNWVDNHQPESREYAINALYLSRIYEQEKNQEMKIRYLILSAIADLRTANHEIYSLQSLAEYCFEQNDLKRSTRYLKYCSENARFYGNRIRGYQLSHLQDTIFKAFSHKVSQQHDLLLVLISILSVCFVILAFFLYRILKEKSRVVRINQQLHEVHSQLHEANRIKEEYISQFLTMCSEYIAKMDKMRKNVSRKLKARQHEELIQEMSDSRLMEQEQKHLFQKFDRAFLELYPDFVAELNNLLRPEEQFTLRKGELFSNEMRICALIRMGIKDSPQIASFTGYSVNTVYTYRTRMRNKALNHDEFESQIMQIGQQ